MMQPIPRSPWTINECLMIEDTLGWDFSNQLIEQDDSIQGATAVAHRGGYARNWIG